MTIWCQLGRRLLNTRKSWIYTMKKRPVFQEDQVPRNEDSATQKQLVLVRTKYESSLSDFLLLAVPGPDCFAWLPKHVWFSPARGSQRVPCLVHCSSDSSPFTLTCATRALSHCRHRCLFFFSKDSCVYLSHSIQNEWMSFKQTFFVSFTLVARSSLYLTLGTETSGVCVIKQARARSGWGARGKRQPGDLSGVRV